MSFRLLPAVPADADELGEILVACSTSQRLVIENADVTPADYLAWHRARVRNSLSICDPNSDVVAFKLVDEETGRIAAYAQWGFSSQAWKKDRELSPNKDLKPPKGTNLRLRQKYGAMLAEMDARNLPKEKHFVLMNLVTAPSFRRKGAASQLVRWGLERADREGVIVVLDSSPHGLPLYKTLGFVEVDRIELDLAEFGGEGTHSHVSMVRKPQALSL